MTEQPPACPTCGATSYGDRIETCTTPTGRDHRARTRAERAWTERHSTSYGRTFTAPCRNDIWDPDTHEHEDCNGNLTYGPNDRSARCDTCGAQCGRLVAFDPRRSILGQQP